MKTLRTNTGSCIIIGSAERGRSGEVVDEGYKVEEGLGSRRFG